MVRVLVCLVAGAFAVQGAEGEDEWRAQFSRGVGLQKKGEFDAAAKALEQALAMTAGAGPYDGRPIAALNALGGIYEELGRYADAERVLRDCVGRLKATRGAKREYAMGLVNLAGLLNTTSRFKIAAGMQREAIAIMEADPAANGVALAAARNGLGESLAGQHRYKEAVPLLEAARAAYVQLLGPAHERTAVAMNNLAAILRIQKRSREAAELFHQVLTIVEADLGPDHPHLMRILNNFATAAADDGRFDEADAAYRRALSIGERRLGKDHPNYASIAYNYASTLRRMGYKQQAKELASTSRAALAAAALRNGLGKTVDARDALAFTER